MTPVALSVGTVVVSVYLLALLEGQPLDHAGEFFSFERAWIQPAPQPAIPRLIGGRASAAMRRTALHGDGCRLFNLMPVAADPETGIAAVAEIKRLLG